jgi:hypothetical protein
MNAPLIAQSLVTEMPTPNPFVAFLPLLIVYVGLAFYLGIRFYKKEKNSAVSLIRARTSYPAFRLLAVFASLLVWVLSVIALYFSFALLSTSVQQSEGLWQSIFQYCGLIVFAVSVILLFFGKLLRELLSIFCDIADSSIETSFSSKNPSN